MSLTAWLWNQYGDDLTDLAKEGIKHLWRRFHWVDAANRYREKVIERYGYTSVLGRPGPILLDDIFTDLFILDNPTASRRYGPESLEESFVSRESGYWGSEKRHPALQLITAPNNQRLFILGKPGAGKTTFLRHIVLQAARGKIDKVPIMVTLRDWKVKEQELLDFIAREFDICNFPDARLFIARLLMKGQAIVLFDGLDEVSLEGRWEVVQQLRDFADQYPSQCLITCRIAASDYVFERFTYVELADFTEEQMRAYASNWFSTDPRKGEIFAKEFFGKKKHAGLRELGRNPILLSLICLAFDETMDFPRRQVEIYEEALDALLKKWDSSRRIRRDEIYRGLSLGRKRQMFARIAAEAFDEGRYVFKQKELARRIVFFLRRLPGEQEVDEDQAEDVLRAIVAQHGIFVEQAHRLYTFTHLTFQEYFSARFIIRNAASGTLRRMMGHLNDDHWREVFLLTSGMLDEAEPFFDAFQWALDEMVAHDELLVALLKWVERKASEISSGYSATTIRVYYLYQALDLARALALDRVRDLDRTLYLNYDLALDCARNLDNALGLNIDQSMGLELARVLDLDSALDCALAHAVACDFARDLDVEVHLDSMLGYILRLTVYFSRLYYVDEFRFRIPRLAKVFASMLEYVWQVGDIVLYRALAALPKLEREWRNKKWKTFLREFQEVLWRERDIGYEWNLDKEQVEILARYLTGHKFLLECLGQASVGNRVEIETRMLLPPHR